jgi:hypothetical protein
MVFPEFAWALDNEILVRDGKVLFPGDSYVDDRTRSIRVLTCLYNYDTQVASILEAEYNLRGLEVMKKVSVNQVKLLTEDEYRVWEGVMIGTLVLALLVLLLALPAAVEVRGPLPSSHPFDHTTVYSRTFIQWSMYCSSHLTDVVLRCCRRAALY